MNSILLTALGLSMDACAASIALSARYKSLNKLLLTALAFGISQALMPAIGYLVGLPFEKWISPIDHWIAFLILGGLGLNMIFDLKKEHELEEKSGALTYKVLVALAIATSIDAFVVGVGFHALGWPFLKSIILIGVVTLVMSLFGLVLARLSKKNLTSHAEKIGGLILIFLGVKILLTHLIGF